MKRKRKGKENEKELKRKGKGKEKEMKRKRKGKEKEMKRKYTRKIFHTTSVALAENVFITKYCGSWKLDPGRGGEDI